MKKQEEKFIAGCQKNGIPKSKAEEIFHLIEPFAGYGFNKAHAACYAMIAYQTAFLKTHYPVEFMTAVLTAESRVATGPTREEKLSMLVEECRRMEVLLLPPDINKSQVEFSIEKNPKGKSCIRFGLSAIKNVGTAAIDSILSAKRRSGEFTTLRDFLTRVDLTKVNKKTVESLTKAGALDQFGKRAGMLAQLSLIASVVQKEKQRQEKGQIGMFEMDSGDSVSESLIEVEEFSKTELLRFEKDLLGFYLTEHPLTPVLSQIANKVSHNIADITLSDVGAAVVVGGIILQLKKIITKSGGQEMAFVKLSDLSGSIELVVFPRIYGRMKQNLVLDHVVVVKGRINEKDNRLTLIVDELFIQ